MSEQKQVIRNAELARHWRVSRSYITKLTKAEAEGGHAMPGFSRVEDADAWRAIHAPAKSGAVFAGERELSPKIGLEPGKKNAGSIPTTTAATLPASQPEVEVIDVASYIAKDGDFDTLMIRQAEEAPQVAHGLFKRASGRGEPGLISATLRNWHEAAKAGADIRERYLTLQEKTGALISLDEVMDVIGTELQAIRGALLKMGERISIAANPADPALARKAIDTEIDNILRKLAALDQHARKELTV